MITLDGTHGISATYAGGTTPIDVPVDATADAALAVTNAAATVQFGGPFGVAGGATLNKTGAGVADVTIGNAGTLQGTLQVTGGTLLIADNAGFDSGAVALNGGTLASDPGTTSPAIVSSLSTTGGGGTVSPGGAGAAGLLEFSNGTVSLNQATVQMDVQGTASTDHDELGVSSSSIDLTGATLAVDTTGYVPSPGDQIVLIDYTAGSLTGQFANAPQGSPVSFGGNSYTVDYAGGNGTQVVLSPAVALSAQDDTYSLPPNTSLVTGSNQPTLFVPPPGILANDTTPYGLPLTPQLVTPAQNGTVLLNTDGSFSYQPAVGFTGADTFTYRDVDSQGHVSNTATVTLYINDTALPPLGNADSFTATQSVPITVNVTNNDYSPSGNPLTATLIAGPVHGTLVDNGGGSFTYTPDPNFTGVDGFIYAATDTVTGLTSGATNVTFNVGVLNQAPTAVDDSYSTAQNSPLFVVGPGVLINDTDPNGDTLSSVVVDNPSHGTLSLSNNGSFSYTPNPNYSGPDSFTYQVSDGSLTSNVATVTIQVTAVPTAATANDDNYSLNEDTTLTLNAPRAAAQRPESQRQPPVDQHRQRPVARRVVGEQRRVAHLHAGRQLQRPGQLHLLLARHRLGPEQRLGQRDLDRAAGARRSGGGGRRLCRHREPDAPGRRAGGARQRPEPRRQPAVGRARANGPAWVVDAELRRVIHLHAERQLQRPGQLHLSGQRRRPPQRRGHG